MPLQATSGAASYDGFGGGVAAVPNYIEDVFSTWLYPGDTGGYIFASSGVSITTGGMMWVKSRGSATNNYIFSPSLTNANYYLNTNTTAAQSNSGVTNNNFEALDNGGGMRFGGAFSGISSSATGPFASWTFRKQPKFFDVVTYTGNGSTQNISHNLGSVPGCIIVKEVSASGNDWQVYHRSTTNTCGRLFLNLTNAENANGRANTWGDNTNPVPPTSTVFTVGNTGSVNNNGATFIAYLFAHDAGGFGLTGTDNVISCGSYTGNGSGSGPTVTLGYEPQWLLIKRTDTTSNWTLIDNMRGIPTGSDAARLFPNLSNAEITNQETANLLATGFKIATADAPVNASGGTYIYIAIRRGPMKVPTSGTSVFSPNASSAANGTTLTTNFPVDLSITQERPAGDGAYWMDRLRGAKSPGVTGTSPYLNSSGTAAETSTTITSGWDNTGIKIAYFGGISCIWWNFRRAPSFFDEVCYTGTGTYGATNHNLGVTPELVIYKSRSNAVNWGVIKPVSSIAYYDGLLNSNAAFTYYSNDPSVAGLYTSTQFAKYQDTSSYTYVAYLFATAAGVSKVGSYTGTGTTLQVNCNFTAGARFVLIKRTDSTGDWYVWDSARGIVSGNDPYLLLNSTAAEVTNTDYVDTYSAGFEISSTAPAAINASGGTFIFLAIA